MTNNALLLLELMGRSDIPVAAGEAKAREDAEFPPYAAFVHGNDGLGNTDQRRPMERPIDQSAAEFLVSQCAAAPGEVTVLAIGPLANLRAAIELVGQVPVDWPACTHPPSVLPLNSQFFKCRCAHAGRSICEQRAGSGGDGRRVHC